MESTPIIILKRPDTVKHDDQTVEKTKSQQSSKTLEEKLAKYEEARRRILGSESEEEKDADAERFSPPPVAEKEKSPSPPLPPPAVVANKGSPEKKSNGITPLMSIEFKQAVLETSMEKMSIGKQQQKTTVEDVLISGRQKKSLFKVVEGNGQHQQQPNLHGQHHWVGPPVPNNFHVRQYVNNSILHPYANSNMNHVRAHHHYPPHHQQQQQHYAGPRFNLGSFTAGQVNFVPNPAPPFSLNVPPPGYFHQSPTPLQFPTSQMSQSPMPNHYHHQQAYTDAAAAASNARQGNTHRHLDMNFS